MRGLVLVLVPFVLAGCATTSTAYVPTVAITPEKRVEMRPLPPDPAKEALPPGTPQTDWVEPLEAAGCLDKAGKAVSGASSPCPARSGLLSSEARASRDALFRLRYPELRQTFEADRAVWAAQRDLYETRLEQADTALKKAEPGWFQEHALQLGVIGGFVLGAGMTVAITFAVHQTK